MPETVSDMTEEEAALPVLSTDEYMEARRAGMRPDAAMVAAQDSRYWAFVKFVDPIGWQVAANRPDMPVEQIVARLIDAGYPSAQVMRAMLLLDQRDEEPEPERVVRQQPYNTPDDDQPRTYLRAMREQYGRGDPDRPSQRKAVAGLPSSRTARRWRQRVREAENAAGHGPSRLEAPKGGV